jgi:hypothetical protein
MESLTNIEGRPPTVRLDLSIFRQSETVHLEHVSQSVPDTDGWCVPHDAARPSPLSSLEPCDISKFGNSSKKWSGQDRGRRRYHHQLKAELDSKDRITVNRLGFYEAVEFSTCAVY